MKQPPTELDRAIALRRAEGRTLQRVGNEFGLASEAVRAICRRVEDHDRGAALLRDDPASIDALALLGEVKPAVQHTLRVRGIEKLTDLDGVTMNQLLSWPNIGTQSAALLLEALARLKKSTLGVSQQF